MLNGFGEFSSDSTANTVDTEVTIPMPIARTMASMTLDFCPIKELKV
jgi:hypothetical protein